MVTDSSVRSRGLSSTARLSRGTGDSLARSQLKRGKSAVEAVEQWHERGRKSVTKVEAIDEERRRRDDEGECF